MNKDNLTMAVNIIDSMASELNEPDWDIDWFDKDEYSNYLNIANHLIIEVTMRRNNKMDNAKLVMASMLIDRANKDLEKMGGDTDSFLFNKTDYNDSLRMARKLLLESYVD